MTLLHGAGGNSGNGEALPRDAASFRAAGARPDGVLAAVGSETA